MKLELSRGTGALITGLVVLTLFAFRPVETSYALSWVWGFVGGFWSGFARGLGASPEMLFAAVFWITLLAIALRWAYRRLRSLDLGS